MGGRGWPAASVATLTLEHSATGPQSDFVAVVAGMADRRPPRGRVPSIYEAPAVATSPRRQGVTAPATEMTHSIDKMPWFSQYYVHEPTEARSLS